MTADADTITLLQRLYVETVGMLDQHIQRAEQGEALQPALEFGKYVLWSGIVSLCQAHASNVPPKIDGSDLRCRAEGLQRLAREKMGNPKTPHVVKTAVLERIDEKPNLIAGRLAQMG